MTQYIDGPLPSERQKNLVMGLLTQRKVTAKDLQADRVGAMNADELTEWLQVKLNRIPTNEQRSLVTDLLRRAPQAAESESEVASEESDPCDEQPTPPRGTLPPISAGRVNEDGLSVFGYEEESFPA